MAQPKLKGTQVDATEIVTHSANNLFTGINSTLISTGETIVSLTAQNASAESALFIDQTQTTSGIGIKLSNSGLNKQVSIRGGPSLVIYTGQVAGSATTSGINACSIFEDGSIAVPGTAAYMGVGTINVANGVYDNGVRITTGLVLENAQSGNYQLVLSDANKLITSVDGTAQTFTVPPNSTVAFPTGTTIAFAQHGAGQLTIAAGGGVTILTEVGLKLNALYAMASMVKTATDSWRLSGSLKA